MSWVLEEPLDPPLIAVCRTANPSHLCQPPIDGPPIPQQTVSVQRPSVRPSVRRHIATLYRYCHYSPTDGCSDRRSRWIRSGGWRRSSARSRGKAPPPPPPAGSVASAWTRRNNNRRRRRRRANRIVFTFNSSSTSRWSFVITALDASQVMSLWRFEIKRSSCPKSLARETSEFAFSRCCLIQR